MGLKNTFFCYFRGFFGVKKFFGRRIRVFQPFLPLEMMFLEKKFFSKKCPQKLAKFSFFFGHPVINIVANDVASLSKLEKNYKKMAIFV